MKKFWTIFISATLLVLVGCESEDNSSSVPYQTVYPGVVIYNAATTQQTVAMDPTAVAVKLAMLLDEAAASETEDLSKVKVTINTREYSLQTLLFGSGVSITQEGESGDWLLAFSTTQIGTFDTFLRQGTYRVSTGGKGFTETSEGEPWSVVVESEKMRIFTANSMTRQYYTLLEGETTLYCQYPGSYTIAPEGIVATIEGYDNFRSDWSGEFLFSTSTIVGDMSFTLHGEDTYTLSGEAEGKTFYSFDNKTTTQMRYSISSLTPDKWMPSKTNPYSTIVSGEEKAYLLDKSEYSITDYPSPEVTVKRELQDETFIYTRVTYNGTSVLL